LLKAFEVSMYGLLVHMEL